MNHLSGKRERHYQEIAIIGQRRQKYFAQRCARDCIDRGDIGPLACSFLPAVPERASKGIPVDRPALIRMVPLVLLHELFAGVAFLCESESSQDSVD
jgi:hypothetical protein